MKSKSKQIKPRSKKILVILGTLLVVIGLTIGLTRGGGSSSEPGTTPEATAEDESPQPDKTQKVYCGKPDCPEALCTTGGDCGGS